MSNGRPDITREVHDRQHATRMHGSCPWCKSLQLPIQPSSSEYATVERHTLALAIGVLWAFGAAHNNADITRLAADLYEQSAMNPELPTELEPPGGASHA